MATAEQVWANINANREKDMRQQIQAMNYEGNQPVEEIANGIPSNGNDAALAQHLADMRATSAEYAKIRTEESRQLWEGIVADNFRRNQANQDQIKTQMAVAQMNQAVKDRSEGDRLFSELQAVARDIPAEVLNREGEEWRIPLDKLRDISKVTDKIQKFQATQPQQRGPDPRFFPQPFENGKLYQLENLPGGNLKIKLATGEEFFGDPLTVTQKLAEAKVHTAEWAGKKIQEAEQRFQQQPAQQPTQVEQPQVQSAPTGSLANDLAARQADALAQQFGFSDKNEMLQWGESVNEKMAKVQQFETTQEATRFYTLCPEFPADQHAIDTVSTIMDTMHLPMTAEGMQMAHALPVQRGDYQPLSQEAIQQSHVGYVPQNNRPTPPPMLKTGNPEVTMQTPDLQNMPLAELRRLAIAQELNGGRR